LLTRQSFGAWWLCLFQQRLYLEGIANEHRSGQRFVRRALGPDRRARNRENQHGV
jgi:hypothetical protein